MIEQQQPNSGDEPRSQSAEPTPTDVTPSRRDRLRPAEFIGFAAILAIFTGVIVYFTTREFALASIFTGVAFIAVVLVLALIGLGGKPSSEDLEARKDLQTPDDGNRWH